MGAILIGAVGSAMHVSTHIYTPSTLKLDYQHRLYGVTNVQIYFYARKYQRDRMFLKCIVVFLWYVKSQGEVATAVESAMK